MIHFNTEWEDEHSLISLYISGQSLKIVLLIQYSPKDENLYILEEKNKQKQILKNL